MNYPDANGAKGSQLVPEAATGFPKVSNSGKTYDFNVKVGYTKFSNGQPVTAANFKAAFDRNADPKMQSPAVPFFSDIVGADKSPVSGVKVSGSHLIINLTHAAPDFLARVAMPFFCAIPTNLAHDPNGVLAPASAGPYYVSDRVPNKSITLKRNPYYKGKRPRNISAVNYVIGNALPATYLRVQQGATDYAAAGIPSASYSEAAQKYGINKGQFWVEPQLGVQYLAMNHDRPLFKGTEGTDLAKAINYAIDRKAMLAQGGYLAGKRTDQILPPGVPAFRKLALHGVREPRHQHDEERPAMGGPLELQRPRPGLEACRLLHVQLDLLGRSGSHLPQVVDSSSNLVRRCPANQVRADLGPPFVVLRAPYAWG